MGQCNNKAAINTTNTTDTAEPDTGKVSVEPKMDATKAGGAVISAEDLKTLVDSAPPNLRVLDVTAGGKDAYEGYVHVLYYVL